MKTAHMVAYFLLWLGGVNWGLITLFRFNLVSTVLGSSPALERLVYILVGVSAVYSMLTHRGDCKVCSRK